MKKLLFTLTFVMLLVSSFCQAQGKIFPAKDADELFGKVTTVITISLTDLQTYLNKTEKYFFINIIDKELHVLGDGRKAITSVSENLSTETVVHKFLKTVVQEFIDLSTKAGTTTISIQLRGETLMLTNGTDGLEYSYLCPPICG